MFLEKRRVLCARASAGKSVGHFFTAASAHGPVCCRGAVVRWPRGQGYAPVNDKGSLAWNIYIRFIKARAIRSRLTTLAEDLSSLHAWTLIIVFITIVISTPPRLHVVWASKFNPTAVQQMSSQGSVHQQRYNTSEQAFDGLTTLEDFTLLQLLPAIDGTDLYADHFLEPCIG